MNHAFKATAHENKIRRWQTFTPPQSTAHAAHCGLVLHWRAYEGLAIDIPAALQDEMRRPCKTAWAFRIEGKEM
jgi:hypothetical protein